MPGLMTKAQRVRVRRVINNMSHPIRHMERDSLRTLLGSELFQLKKLLVQIWEEAVRMGYDPEEVLPDVSVNWRPGQ